MVVLIAMVIAAIVGFDPAKVTVDATTAFSNGSHGTWSAQVSG